MPDYITTAIDTNMASGGFTYTPYTPWINAVEDATTYSIFTETQHNISTQNDNETRLSLLEERVKKLEEALAISVEVDVSEYL